MIHALQIVALVTVVIVVIYGVVRVFWRRKAPPEDDPLGKVIFKWNEIDECTLRNCLTGFLILGVTGSGKSSSSAKLLAKSLIRYPKSGGLVLCGKPEDTAAWRDYARQAGREEDLILFGPDHHWARLNCVQYILDGGGRAKEVARFLMTVSENMRSSDSDGREDSSFWQQQQERVIYLAVTVLWIAFGKVSVPDLQQFVNGAAMSAEQAATDEWKGEFHFRILQKAFAAKKTPTEAHDLDLAFRFWLTEFPGMADRTRSSILVGVMGTLHTYCAGYARVLLSEETTVSPDDVLAGKWIVINACPSEFGDTGCLINAAWKWLLQRRLLKREAKPGDRCCWIFADESQQFVNSHDANFLSQSRSHLASMVYITQSVSSFYGAMGGDKGMHIADSLMANFAHCILHASDAITARWGNEKIGRRLKTFIGTSNNPSTNVSDELIGISKMSMSTSTHMEMIVEANLFQNNLRCGGKAAKLIADGVVVKSGEAFASTGENFIFVPFSQK